MWHHIRPIIPHKVARMSAALLSEQDLPRLPQAIHGPHMAKKQRLVHVLGLEYLQRSMYPNFRQHIVE